MIRAIEECLPRTARQCCLAHKVRNLQSKVPEDLWPEFNAPYGCYQAASPARESRLPIRPVLVGYLRHIGGAAGITKLAAAMRARTGQGRDRLPSCPHPVWSSIQFATGCRSDRGSRSLVIPPFDNFGHGDPMVPE